MFTFDEESLLSCLTLGYACYNGKLFFPEDPGLQKEASYADGKWFQVSAESNVLSGYLGASHLYIGKIN